MPHSLLSTTILLTLCAPTLLLSAEKSSSPQAGALSPEEALQSFEIAPGFSIELLAAEPLITDPVAMEIDEQGRIYVVEMHGYPLDKSRTGAIKLLLDEDGDGKPDRATVFADELRFPNGVMRWKKGILVTDAPDLIYLEDTDGDGIADKREVVITGFARSNPQHIVNGPIYGLDNWIYLANEPAVTPRIYVKEFGDRGSEIHFPNRVDAESLPINAGGRQVRLKPDSGRLEALSSATQFGHSFDTWGRHLLVSNERHVFHEVIAARYLERNPALLLPSAVTSLPDHGDAAEVFPITEHPEHQMLTRVGVFTSACGILHYGGGLFPAPYDQVSFVAEPVSNLVHADLLSEKGASFQATRLFEKSEFLRSRDAWFRPVSHYIGPDGALYVIDYYRRIIEHPEWMAKEVAESPHLHDGRDRGRIYRITPEGTAPIQWTKGTDLATADDQQLVARLGSKNIWYRRNAQRMLLDRYPSPHSTKDNTNPSLRASASSRETDSTIPADLLSSLQMTATSAPDPLARLHAAWTLDGLDTLTPEIIQGLLCDKEPGLRENALVLAESRLGDHPDLQKTILSLSDEPNARTRFQWLCTLGGIDTPEAAKLRKEALFTTDDAWMQAAALSAARLDYDGLLAEAIQRGKKPSASWRSLVQRLAAMRSRDANPEQIQQLLGTLTQASEALGAEKSATYQAALLSGIAQAASAASLRDPRLASEREHLLTQALENPNEGVRRASFDLLSHMGLPEGEARTKALAKATQLMSDESANAADRTLSIALVALAEPGEHRDTLSALLHTTQPVPVQRAALAALAKKQDAAFFQDCLTRWPNLSEEVRNDVIGILMPSEEGREALVMALEKGVVSPDYFAGSLRIGFIARSDLPTRARIRAVLERSESDTAGSPDGKKDADLVPEAYRKALAKGGSKERGKLVYQQQCAACHLLGGERGTPIGPDLNSIRIREPEAIVTDILEPNRSIADGYALWQIALKDGSEKIGVIAAETPSSLTLRAPGAEEELIPLSSVASRKEVGISLMPTGLGALIPPEAMADLIAYIKNPD